MPDIFSNIIFNDKNADKVISNLIQKMETYQQTAVKTNEEIKKAGESAQKALTSTVKSSDNAFSNFTKKASSVIGSLAKMGLAYISIQSAAKFAKFAIDAAIEGVSKTKEGQKALDNVALGFEKVKNIGKDFAGNILNQFLPAIQKALPTIIKGFTYISAGAAGVVSVVGDLASNYSIFLTQLYNGAKIAFNRIKEFFGDEEAGKKADELKKQNIELGNSYKSMGAIFKDAKLAFDSQLESSQKAADATRLNKELTNEQKKAIEARNKALADYKKILDDLAKKTEKAQLDLLEIKNPKAKLDKEREIAIKAVDELAKQVKDAAIEAAKKTGKKVELPVDFDLNINLQKEVIESRYRTELAELIKSLRKINIEELGTDKFNLDDIIEDTLKNAFKVPDSVFKDAKKLGIKLNSIAGFIFTDTDGQKSIDEGLAENERDLAAKIKKHVDKTVELTNGIIAKGNKKDAADRQNPIAQLLGIDDADFDLFSQAAGQIFNSLQAAQQAALQRQIEQNDTLLSGIRERIGEAQKAVDAESEAQARGSANNLATKQKELAALKDQETRALAERAELQKKAARQQLISDSAQQASGLITSAVNFFTASSKIPLVGIGIAISAIATMFALIARYKAQAKAASEVRAFTGGDLERDFGMVKGLRKKGIGSTEIRSTRDHGVVGAVGKRRTDRGGNAGHRVEGTNLIISGYEYINNEQTTQKHRPFLDKLNRGYFDGVNIEKLLIKSMSEETKTHSNNSTNTRSTLNTKSNISSNTQSRFVRMQQEHKIINLYPEDSVKKKLDNFTKIYRKKVHQDKNQITKADLMELKKEIATVSKRITEIPVIIPIAENTTGYIKKTPGLTEHMKFDDYDKGKRMVS